jgi:hypothetical protein
MTPQLPAIVFATDPRYAALRAQVHRGRASIGRVRYYPGGAKAVEFVPRRKRNDGTIGLDPEFFQGALKDYSRWPIKWWREAIQNAVDARATAVECGVETFPDRVVVWCHDNGRGMDRETLLTKFLRLGASGKRGDADAKGGFGKAKEMLLLPWISWQVTTRDIRVDGHGISYQESQAPGNVGTRLEVVMPPDNCTTLALAQEFIGRCSVPKVAFRLVEKNHVYPRMSEVREVTASSHPGRVVREIAGKANIHYIKSAPSTGNAAVRTGGLWMYDRYIPSTVKGQVTIELIGPSIELLTANRDGIRDYALNRAIDEFLGELSADTKSALKEQKEQTRVYRGQGLIEAKPSQELAAELLSASSHALELATPEVGGVRLSGDTVAQIVDALRADPGSAEAATVDGRVQVGSAPAGAASVLMQGAAIRGQDHLERALKQLAWQPDLIVINDVEDFRPPRTLLPEKMGKAALRLLKVWTELCRATMVLLGSDASFGVGWLFSDDAGAAAATKQGEAWLVLNPHKGRPREKLFDPTDPVDLRWLVALAIHEATHIADGISYHDEAFSTALTLNMARCAALWAMAPRIVDAVTAGAKVSARKALELGAPLDIAAPQRVELEPDDVAPPWFTQPIQATGAPAVLRMEAPQAARSKPRQMGLFR